MTDNGSRELREARCRVLEDCAENGHTLVPKSAIKRPEETTARRKDADGSPINAGLIVVDSTLSSLAPPTLVGRLTVGRFRAGPVSSSERKSS